MTKKLGLKVGNDEERGGNALEVFSLSDANMFLADLPRAHAAFKTEYLGGQIAHNAHTHCHEIVMTVAQLAQILPHGKPSSSKILALGASVVTADTDVIVPVMKQILEETNRQFDDIVASARRDPAEALRRKEQFWARVNSLYKRTEKALQRVNRLLMDLALPESRVLTSA